MRLFDQPSRQPLPQPNFDDVTHAGRQAIVSLIPVLGGPASELLGLLGSPVAQRRDDWLADLARRLRELEGQVEGFRFDELGQNEQFVSATLVATQAALRTHQEEKLHALRNAVLNVAAGSAPNEDLQGIFLNWVDRLTALHLRLLTQFSLQRMIQILDAPDWLKQDICSHSARDLLDQGLLGPLNNLLVPNRDHLIVGEKGFYTFRAGLTSLGNQFLSFIREPKEAKNDGL